MAKAFAAIDVRDMHFDHWPVKHVERIQKGDRCMAIACRIDNHPVCFGTCVLDPVNDLTFVIGLFKTNLKAQLIAYSLTLRQNILKRVVTVELWLTRAQHVQVWAIQNLDMFRHDAISFCWLAVLRCLCHGMQAN